MNAPDVLIMGGGLAGLTLAMQLRGRHPDLDILVLERRRHPVPEAAFKIGESTVEIGANYFSNVLGLKPHLQGAQLKKFGFRFFFSEGRRDIDQVLEIGASRYLSTPSYQIDRGIFENFLGEEATRRGIRFLDGTRVTGVDLGTGGAPHTVTFVQGADGPPQRLQTRWVIDACGRVAMLKRKLGLEQLNDHPAYSIWFRISDRIAIDEWSDDPAWRARCDPQARWLSTNHLVGKGYWVWLIPLSSGSHSVGVVADPRIHPFETMDTFDKAMDWFRQYQPRLYDDLDGKRDKLQDFAFFKRFSYACKQVYSADRWALAGEAGLFLDPFYSPGSDFIAISNTYITELVSRDRAGHSVQAHAQIYDQIMHTFYESTMALYYDMYPLFGDPEVLPVKVIWDYTYYWGVLSQLAFNNRLADVSMLSALRDELGRCRALNTGIQQFLRGWSTISRKRNRAVMLDQASLPWFAELNRSLTDTLDDAAFRARLRHSTAQLEALAREIVVRARAAYPEVDDTPMRALLAQAPESDNQVSEAAEMLGAVMA
jgi:flavin-dependent dehydrogenase